MDKLVMALGIMLIVIFIIILNVTIYFGIGYFVGWIITLIAGPIILGGYNIQVIVGIVFVVLNLFSK